MTKTYIHTFSAADEALIDIFSCKAYNQQRAVDAVLEYFEVPPSKPA